MLGFINEWQEKLGVKIVCSQVCIRALAAAQLTLKSLRNVLAEALILVAFSDKQQTTKSTAVSHMPSCPQETEPMGTAGPLALARHLLDDGSGTPFFVLNR